MAEEDSNQVGVVGRDQNQAPRTGIPGVQGPPVPTQEQIKEAMRKQQEAIQQQINQARKMAGYDGQSNLPTEQPQQNSRFSQQQKNQSQQPRAQGMGEVPAHIQASMPPSMRPSAPSPAPGMEGRIQSYQKEEIVREKIPWYPIRGAGESVSIDLTDITIMNVPSRGVTGEADAASKVVLALLSEILALRDRLDYLESQGSGMPQGMEDLPQRVYSLEATLFEQRQALQQSARSVREQIEMFSAKGMSAEEILSNLSGQQVKADKIAKGESDDKKMNE